METLYERRKFTRWPFAEPVQIRLAGRGGPSGSLAQDIGIGGMSILVSRFLPKSSKLEIQGELNQPGQRFSGVAKVVWTEKVPYAEERYRVGLEFIELNGESQKSIWSYLGKLAVFLISILLIGFLWSGSSLAYWEWTPQTGRWINPKYSSKATPQEQYEWAVQFYEAAEYKKAVREFSKLVKHYSQSEYAPRGQAGLGEAYEAIGEYYRAFQEYQKLIGSYPSYPGADEIIERQYRIGNLFFEGHKRKLLGVAILPSGTQAVEIFQRVVDNAPFGLYGEAAQYKIGECYKKMKKYSEAKGAFETLVHQYPDGDYVEVARFQVALCTVKESKKSYYDQEATDRAIAEFRSFIRNYPQHESAGEAAKMIGELLDRKAEKSYDAAKFYESQKDYKSARIYYQDIIARYPESSYAVDAKERLEQLLGHES